MTIMWDTNWWDGYVGTNDPGVLACDQPIVRTKSPQVLVVDDEQLNRYMLCRVLEQNGIQVQSATSGEEAINLINNNTFDLVMLDISMPGMDGFDVLMQVRKISNEIELPVIMVTGSDERDQVIRAFDCGANDYVNKPVDVGIAIARIKTQIRLKSAHNALRESEERYALAAQGANDGLWDWNLTSNVVFYSPRWKSMVGIPEQQTVNKPDDMFSRVHADDCERVDQQLQAHLDGETPHFETELRIRHGDNTYRWMLCRGMAVRNKQGTALRLAGSLTDITEGKVADALTGLPNRLMFKDQIDRCLERYRRDPSRVFCVMYLDVDNFKLVNDSYGHEAGDQLLIELSRRLSTVIRESDTLVSRLGGDEFAVVFPNLPDQKVAQTIAQRILQCMDAPIDLENDRTAVATMSIGISIASERCRGSEDILREADTAMYQAKANGKSRYSVYDPQMHADVRCRLSLENELRNAVQEEQFVLHYQPIMELKTGRLVGAEALIRWQRPDAGLTFPGDFVTVAEETGLVVPMGAWVIREACRQARAWRETSSQFDDFYINVNVSSRQFGQNPLVETVTNALNEAQVAPSALRIEVTESAFVEDSHLAGEILNDLRAKGIRIAVDDFGTGYSSLSYLRKLPLDNVKIDRSFISEMTEDSNDTIVRAIVGMSSGLGLELIAEGIEDGTQLNKLKDIGCEYGQGFLMCRPVPPEELREKLTEWNFCWKL